MIGDVIRYTRIFNHPPVVTTDATPTELANIAIDDGLAGMLLIDIQSIVTDGSASNAGRYAVKYSKVGTLTLGTFTTIYEDNGVAISISVVADGSENISIKGTGIASTEINWIVRTQLLDQNYTALP